MSRSLAPHRWRRFYGSVLTLMLIDIGWTGINQLRGLHVGAWLAIDTATVLVILLMMWWQRGKADSMRPSYIGLTLIAVTSVLAYWLEHDMYLP
jgi:K+ transporter